MKNNSIGQQIREYFGRNFDTLPKKDVKASEIMKYLKYTGSGKTFEKLSKVIPPMSVNPPTYIGIEIEVEEVPDIYSPIPYWAIKTDSSLRNSGREFVSYALEPAQVAMALAMLYSSLRSTASQKPQFTWRTSTHIHLNVRDLTQQQFILLILIYCIFEKAMFKFADIKRSKGNFCVPIVESSLSNIIKNFVSGKISVAKSAFTEEWGKYSALNLTRLYDLGTVEFRHFPGTWNFTKLHSWVDIILHLYDYVYKISVEDYKVKLDELTSLNTSSMYYALCDNIFGAFNRDLLNSPEFESQAADGVSFVKTCVNTEEYPKFKEGSGLDTLVKRIKKPEVKKKVGQQGTVDQWATPTPHFIVEDAWGNSQPMQPTIYDEEES